MHKRQKTFPTTPPGYEALVPWSPQQTGAAPEACQAVLEATGPYPEGAAQARQAAGRVGSVSNPKRVKDCAQGLGMKANNDPMDSFTLARFGALAQPRRGPPEAPEYRRLSARLHRLEALDTDRQREANRLEKARVYGGASEFDPAVDILPTRHGPKLLPADPRLAQVTVDKMPASNNIRENTRQLLRHLSLVRDVLTPLADDYDYILIDSHPEISDLLRTVVFACDYCVSPVKLDLQSTIGVPSAQQAINEVNADVDMISRALGPIPGYSCTKFVGAIGMMAREWGGMLKATERAEYRRLHQAGGIFEYYVMEGDGLRQAAALRCPVYDVAGANAERQALQFREITQEFLTKCP